MSTLSFSFLSFSLSRSDKLFNFHRQEKYDATPRSVWRLFVMFRHVLAGGEVILTSKNHERRCTALYRVPSRQTGAGFINITITRGAAAAGERVQNYHGPDKLCEMRSFVLQWFMRTEMAFGAGWGTTRCWVMRRRLKTELRSGQDFKSSEFQARRTFSQRLNNAGAAGKKTCGKWLTQEKTRG